MAPNRIGRADLSMEERRARIAPEIRPMIIDAGLFNVDHGMLRPAGIALVFNLLGFLVTAMAVVGVCRAKRQNAVALSFAIALVGVAIVICGASVVISSE
jgi:hypothetical protein